VGVSCAFRELGWAVWVSLPLALSHSRSPYVTRIEIDVRARGRFAGFRITRTGRTESECGNETKLGDSDDHEGRSFSRRASASNRIGVYQGKAATQSRSHRGIRAWRPVRESSTAPEPGFLLLFHRLVNIEPRRLSKTCWDDVVCSNAVPHTPSGMLPEALS